MCIEQQRRDIEAAGERGLYGTSQRRKYTMKKHDMDTKIRLILCVNWIIILSLILHYVIK